MPAPKRIIIGFVGGGSDLMWLSLDRFTEKLSDGQILVQDCFHIRLIKA